MIESHPMDGAIRSIEECAQRLGRGFTPDRVRLWIKRGWILPKTSHRCKLLRRERKGSLGPSD